MPITIRFLNTTARSFSTSRSVNPSGCGVPTAGDPWSQFRVQYYLYAIAFVVFDVEVLFLYPWAVVFKAAGLAGFAAMTVFLLAIAAHPALEL